jgi:hypothetical protein
VLPLLPAADAISEKVTDALMQLVSALNERRSSEQQLLSDNEALDLADVLSDMQLPSHAAAAARFMGRGYKQLANFVRQGNGPLAAALCKRLLPPAKQQQQQ